MEIENLVGLAIKLAHSEIGNPVAAVVGLAKIDHLEIENLVVAIGHTNLSVAHGRPKPFDDVEHVKPEPLMHSPIKLPSVVAL